MKHVFEVIYGRLYYCGEFVRETANFVVYSGRRGLKRKEVRTSKSMDVHVIDCDDPKAVIAAYNAASRGKNDAVIAAGVALAKAEEAQRSSALAAALALANPSKDEG